MGGAKKFKFKKIGGVKTWQLILILIPLLFITATLMRFDHIRMTELKAAVLTADEEGDDEKIKTAMTELKEFVDTHTVINIIEKNGINEITFGTGPFYLENLYERKAAEALTVAQAQAGTDANPYGNVFVLAGLVCEPLAAQNRWRWATYLECINNEIAKYPAAETITETYIATLPSTALFRYDYASPAWTATPSGFMTIICLVLIVVIFIRFLIWCVQSLSLLFLKK